MKRKLRCVAMTIMIFTMIFGSVVGYSYSNSNSPAAEPSVSEDNVKNIEDSNASTIDKTTESNKLSEDNSNATPKEPARVEDAEVNAAGGQGSNPDHLTGPGNPNPAPTVIDKKADPYLGDALSKKLFSFRSALDNEHPKQGEVKLTKTAEPVPGKVNTFHVKLRMEATDKEQTNDIVLVIDTSGSMNDYYRMYHAKSAARQFVNQLLTETQPNTRIALVSFAGSAVLQQDFKNYQNKDELIGAINSLSAEGGTFTQAGFKLARNKLAESTADFKNIVFLSDGEPTYGYKINNPDSYLKLQYIEEATPGWLLDTTHLVNGLRLATTSAVPESEFDYSSIVAPRETGYAMFHRYARAKYYNFGNSAIAEAGYAKAAGINVHSIAVQAGPNGEKVLEQSASSPSNYHATNNPNQLERIFSKIAASISSAMKDAKVTDPMGVGFEVSGGVSNVMPTQGTVTLEGNQINWNVGNLTEPVSEGSLTRYAEMKYDVEINDNILNAKPDKNGEYETNKGASVSYKDINGKTQIGHFPDPTVKPMLLKLEKKLLDSNGKTIPQSELDNRNFTFNLNPTKYGPKDYTLNPGNDKVITDLRTDGEHTLKETGVSGNPVSDLSDYETSIKWETADHNWKVITDSKKDGKELNFDIPKGNDKKPLNAIITVTNKEKADGTLTITKEFKPLRSAVRSLAPSMKMAKLPSKFKLNIVGIGYDGKTEVYNKTKEISIGKTIKLDKLPYGTYTVTEENGEKHGVIYKNDAGEDSNKVKVSIDNKNRSMILTNHPEENDERTSVTATKKWVNGPKSDHAAPPFELYANGEPKTDVNPTIEPADGTASQFNYKWSGLQKYDDNGKEIVYMVKEANVSDNSEVTVNGNTYKVSQEENVITNTYVQPLTDENIVATKTWLDADNLTAKPDIKFELWRMNGTAEEGEKVEDAKAVENDKVDFGKQLKTDINGVEYTYYVKEVFSNPKDKDSWNVSEDRLEVTNTYVQPTVDENASMKLEKSSKQNSFMKVGDEITFTFKITNTGNVEINDVMLTDEMLGIKDEVVVKSLKPGESKTVEKTYKVTADDVKKGKIVNSATIKGTTPEGTQTEKDTHTIMAKSAPKTPDTGDNSDILYMCIGLFAATLAAVVAFAARKKL